MNSYSDLEPVVAKLSYFKDIRERRAWMARVTVVVALVLLLGLNTYLLFLSASAVVMNIDLMRWEQSELHDHLNTQIIRLEIDLEEMRELLEEAELAEQ